MEFPCNISHLCRFACMEATDPCALVDIPVPRLSIRIHGIVLSISIQSNIENAPNLEV